MEVTLLLVIAIFAINVYLARPVLESFLFSLALAVGLTPQLLPAIISINLALGAKRMAREGHRQGWRPSKIRVHGHPLRR
jgi:Mg2+-importing ATPase